MKIKYLFSEHFLISLLKYSNLIFRFKFSCFSNLDEFATSMLSQYANGSYRYLTNVPICRFHLKFCAKPIRRRCQSAKYRCPGRRDARDGKNKFRIEYIGLLEQRSKMSLPVYDRLYRVPRFAVTVIWISRESPAASFSSRHRATASCFCIYILRLARLRARDYGGKEHSRFSRASETWAVAVFLETRRDETERSDSFYLAFPVR